MRKIKYQGGLTKLLMSRRGRKNRKRFSHLSTEQFLAMVQRFDSKSIALDVVSFSSSNDFFEQVLSILSFQRYVGIPQRWTLYSDGSHKGEEIELINKVFPFVQIKKIDFNDTEIVRRHLKAHSQPYFDQFLHYSQNSPYGKKLFYYLNHKVNTPTLFIDSDILFYKLANSAMEKVLRENTSGWYLPDQVWGCLDSRYKAQNPPQVYQVNSGFFILNKEFEKLEEGFEFLQVLKEHYESFTEQTFYHILLKANDSQPLDPRIFTLHSGDQFDVSYKYDKNHIAIRHYTTPVRHKMWQRDWKWQLSLDEIQ